MEIILIHYKEDTLMIFKGIFAIIALLLALVMLYYASFWLLAGLIVALVGIKVIKNHKQ